MSDTARTKQRVDQKKDAGQRRTLLIGIVVFAAAIVTAVVFLSSGGAPRETVEFPDIHGISFTGDGTQIRVATHYGLVAYADGRWSKPDLPVNDYMGYSGTQDGFFTSGHPSPGSNLPNPVGLLRSDDHGATIQTVAFSGETDFHIMGASYFGETVYVLNAAPNSTLSTGLYYSLDGGTSWEQSAARGLVAAPLQLAVHPREPGIVAAATLGGLYLSDDFGQSFTRIGGEDLVTFAVFDPDGERLLFGLDSVFVYTLASGEVASLPTAPAVDAEQAILFAAVSPTADEIAVTTSDLDVLLSRDGGRSWRKIGQDGKSL